MSLLYPYTVLLLSVGALAWTFLPLPIGPDADGYVRLLGIFGFIGIFCLIAFVGVYRWSRGDMPLWTALLAGALPVSCLFSIGRDLVPSAITILGAIVLIGTAVYEIRQKACE